MSALVSGLDENASQHGLQRGENGHIEHGWNLVSKCDEEIVKLFFQLVRTTNKDQLNKFESVMQYILKNGNYNEKKQLFKMTAYTRDLVAGKGEYDLFFMQVMVWYECYDKDLAMFLLKSMVVLEDKTGKNIHPYGSWKDIKHFCQYCYERSKNNAVSIFSKHENHDLIEYCVDLMVEQLKKDENNIHKPKRLSLAGKWCCREGSKKYTWLYTKLAQKYYSEYMRTADQVFKAGRTVSCRERAAKKANMDFRKLLSKLNKALDTVQVKQCQGNWSDIDHNKTTSITLKKQTKAFQNIKKDGSERSDTEDRIECAKNFNEYINRAKTDSTIQVKGKRVSIYDFVKAVLKYEVTTQTDFDTLNLQWENNKTQNSPLENFFAMVDTSGSMESDDSQPMYNAIGLGIRIAEMSKMGKRVLTFHSNPTWVNLENKDKFTDMVWEVRRASWGGSTDIYKAFKMILDVVIKKKLRPDEVENMALVILSDMQIDDNCRYGSNGLDKRTHVSSENQKTLFENINKMYAEAGMKVIGEPYSAPHLVFWNLRSTSGFPTMSSNKNCTMMSGNNPAMLNAFCEKGLAALKDITPWQFLQNVLSNERYDTAEIYFNRL
jgi:Mg-chelatase subunit ChlD